MELYRESWIFLMGEVIAVVLSVIIVLSIAAYATWLFFHRLRAGEGKAKSFGEWLKNVFEAIWGL